MEKYKNKQGHYQKRIYKIVAVSDTHGSMLQMQQLIEKKQEGDFFIHCGDFTRYGREQNFENFFAVLKKLNFNHKIILSGNHQISLDQRIKPSRRQKYLMKYPCKYSRQQLLKMMKNINCIYLQHDFIEIEGIKFFGSPYTKKYGQSAFQYSQSDDVKVWKNLPEVDILLTHCPPYGILDQSQSSKHGGSQALKKEVFRIKPKIHIFGHIHEGKGQKNIQGIQFYNVAKQHINLKFQL